MNTEDPQGSATPEALAAYVARHLAQERAAVLADHEHHTNESVRQATYKGHQITIRTTYVIDVDGVPIEGHMGVTNDGRVHYHAVPNLSFASAIDMVKQIIDAFPDDFTARKPDTQGHHHGEEQ